MKLKAHIPTQQYGFIEVEADIEDKDKLEQLYNQYAETPINFNSSKQLLKAFAGGSIYYDAVTHQYTNQLGEVYLSGSKYAESFKAPFDTDNISLAMAKKWGVDQKSIKAMWQLKSEISMGFGTAIHAALELYNKHRGLAEAMEKTTHLHDHPIIKNAVESFYEAHKEDSLSEVLVVDHAKKRAGQIDRLVIVDEKKKVCRVEDFKTNADITKDIEVYWKQLEFYSEILQADGWTTEKEVIHHFNGGWKEYVNK